MADNLYPENYEDETIDEETLQNQPQVVGYEPGLAFDEKAGDFIRDGKNQIMTSTGVDSWKSWVMNCLQTQRYAYMAYGTDFGIEYDRVFAAESRAEAESILTRQITEAIMADPYGRTAYVEDIQFEWPAADSVQIDATIVGIDDITIDVTANITGGDV